MVDGQTLVVLMFSHDDYARQYDRDLWNELQRDGLAMQLVGLTGERQSRPDALLNMHDAADDIWLLFPYLLFTQMLAFESSAGAGADPDNLLPDRRGQLAWVKGVTIYRFPPEL